MKKCKTPLVSSLPENPPGLCGDFCLGDLFLLRVRGLATFVAGEEGDERLGLVGFLTFLRTIRWVHHIIRSIDFQHVKLCATK